MNKIHHGPRNANFRRRAKAAGCAVVLLALPAGCDRNRPPDLDGPGSPAAPASEPPGLLVDVTAQAGIDFVHDAVRKGDFLFPEINGAGCGFLDYDNDGFIDIYLVQSGRDLKHPEAPAKPNRLYRNRGDGTFEDVTDASGAGDTGYGQGLACGDYDNNGCVDIYVANVGGPSVLLRNNGDGTFTDVTKAAGVGNGRWAITPAFVDYDRDGFLDLFATNYVKWSLEDDVPCFTSTGQRDYCGPRQYEPAPAVLYHNNGDGTFTDVTKASGVARASGAGMGIICADFDDDGWLDVYVANDTYANQLWINQGDGTFADRAFETGTAVNSSGVAVSSMGTNVEDFDHDGDLDLFSTNYHAQGSVLYLQGPNHVFSDVSTRTRLFAATAARTGYGACFFDLFNDGTLCVWIGNGAAVMGGAIDTQDDSYAQRDIVLQWSADVCTFTDISDRIGPALDQTFVGRGVAVADFDNDGAVDVLVSNNNGPARLFRNHATRDNHWLKVRCMTPDGKRDAIGAKVFVTAAGQTRRRDVVVNYSYGSASDPRIHFGLGPNTIARRVTVRWPGGAERTWKDVPADQLLIATLPETTPP